jgi:hypothetical protein
LKPQRAVKRLEEMAAEGNPTVQMLLPMAQMLGWLRKGMSELVVRAGLELAQLLMDEEVNQLVGERGRPLMDRAASLGEGLEETLSVLKLHVPEQLRKTLASTNLIESAFAIVETVCRKHGGDQRERWVGSGLLVAERQFRRVRGHKQIPALIKVLESLKPPKHVAARRKAS